MEENKHLYKNKLRQDLMNKRHDFSPDEILKKSVLLCNQIIDSEIFRNSNTIFSYISFKNEVDTFYLLDKSINEKKILCVPVVLGQEMIASRLFSFDKLKKNKFGILEPESMHEINKNDIDLIIVPALGCNTDGFRLGYGAGYYDRYLKDYNGMTAGMIFKEFIIDFEPEDFDIPVKKLFIL
jgi:5-formyltetrahydrofolate cyclo-ligase